MRARGERFLIEADAEPVQKRQIMQPHLDNGVRDRVTQRTVGRRPERDPLLGKAQRRIAHARVDDHDGNALGLGLREIIIV